MPGDGRPGCDTTRSSIPFSVAIHVEEVKMQTEGIIRFRTLDKARPTSRLN